MEGLTIRTEDLVRILVNEIKRNLIWIESIIYQLSISILSTLNHKLKLTFKHFKHPNILERKWVAQIRLSH